MTASHAGFNLVDEPWIALGERAVSIRGAVASGHELPGWPSGEPVAAAVIIRLLMPIVYRASGMDDPELGGRRFADRQQRLLAAGRLDSDSVNEYLDRHRDRFWLTGAPEGSPPFAQDPTLSAVEPLPITKLVGTWASGNNPTLGPHAPVGDIDLAAAARWLLVTHSYGSGGLHTRRPPGGPTGKFQNSRLRRTMSLHPVGPTFAETLLHHLVPVADGHEFGDPSWEAPHPSDQTVSPRSRAGLLEQLAGRHDKTVLLSVGDKGRPTGVVVSAGPGRNEGLEYPDPYLVTEPGHRPHSPRAGRDAWRDIDALVIHSDEVRPEHRLDSPILAWWQNNSGAAVVPERWALVSHRSYQTKEQGWGLANLPDLVGMFPHDTAAARTATAVVAAAENASSVMGKQLSALSRATSGSSKSARYTDARAVFWSGAEPTFWAAVTADDPDPTPQAAWVKELRRHALAGFDAATAHLTQAPRTHMAVEMYRRWVEFWGRPQVDHRLQPLRGGEKT